MTDTTLTPTTTSFPRKTALYAAVGAGLVVAGALAATLVLRAPQSGRETAAATEAGGSGALPLLGAAAVAGAAGAKAGQAAPQDAPANAARKPAPRAVTTAAPRGGDAPVALDTRPAADTPAPVCATCGTVEAVSTVKQKGEGTGLGAVAGGVLGGVVGNQMGSGSGRKAMTVIGAVGGGIAGHEIEKRQRATTAYKVTVRMDDGTRRTLTRGESWAVGRRVTVEGDSLRAMRSATPADGTVRTLKTAAPA
jgi:outer membrane lipoprotein SlyB